MKAISVLHGSNAALWRGLHGHIAVSKQLQKLACCKKHKFKKLEYHR